MKTNTLLPWWTFILLLGQPCQTESYKVTVTTLTRGPIPVGSYTTVYLTCVIDPIPPGPLSYVWYTSALNSYISMQGPNATVTINTNHLKQALYFCHVQSNGSELAVGYTVIKPQGFLIPIGPTEVTYHYGDTIVLGVNISSYYPASYIQSLQWYKDGNPLPVNSSDIRVYTNTMGTRLTIQRAGRSDEGQYTVKIQNIQEVNNSYGCIQNILSLLEGHYAAHSPVTFTISSSSVQGGTYHPSVAPELYVNTTTSINIQKVLNVQQFQFQSCFCNYCPIPFQPFLYFNGVQLSDSRVVYTMQNGTLLLNISNATSSDLGVYEVVIMFCGRRFRFYCSPYYFEDLFNFIGWLYAIEQFTVQQYVPPQVSLQAVPTHSSHKIPIIVITCAALNGTPDVHNITLMKNGSVLGTVVGGNTLTYTVTWSGLGQYVCEVDSLYSTHQESVVLRESAVAKLQLMRNENMRYLCQNEPSYVQNMTTQLRYLTETLCSCTLSNDTFTQANVTCPSNNDPSSAVVSVWVQYASDDGLVTASDLISMIQNWLLDSSCGCVAIEGSTLQLSRGCCINGTTLQDTFTSGQVAIGTVGGFVGGILLTICLGACVILSIAKIRKPDDSLNTRSRDGVDGGSGGRGNGVSTNFEMKHMPEIGMEENGAYETVRYGL